MAGPDGLSPPALYDGVMRSSDPVPRSARRRVPVLLHAGIRSTGAHASAITTPSRTRVLIVALWPNTAQPRPSTVRALHSAVDVVL